MADKSRESFHKPTPAESDLLGPALAAAKGAESKSAEVTEQLKAHLAEFRNHATIEQNRFDQHECQLREHEGELEEIKQALNKMEWLGDEMRGTRSDVQQLTRTVMESLSQDALRERDLGEVKRKVESIAAGAGRTAGRNAGLSAGALVSVAVTVIWLVAFIVAVANGIPPPALPTP